MKKLMQIQNLDMVFNKRGKIGKKERLFHVLKNINFEIYEGEILAVVGESGCGKTTLGKIITGLLKPTKGEILFEGKRTYGFMGVNAETKKLSKKVQFVQQDSYAALNPVRTIYQSLRAPIKTHNKKMSEEDINNKIETLMGYVGLLPASQFLNKFPHQLSGGQRQRVLMARALSLDPKLIIADEPVSMIDVSLRLSILKLMTSLNKTLNVTFVYITHDLATARYIAASGRLMVMYLGEIMEIGKLETILNNPKHPYTQALLSAVPVPDPDIANIEKEIPIKSMDMISLEHRKDCCSFFHRCIYATEKCSKELPIVENIDGVEIRCSNIKEVPKWEIS
jgi:peptide/nickel transport system ATP-binding protein